MRHRIIGVVAGLGPAALILGYYLVTGGPLQAGLLTIVAAAVAAGWLVGPRVRGNTRGDILAVVAYLIVGYLLHSAIDVVLAVWDAAVGIGRDSPSVLEAIRVRAVVTVIYFPVWAVFLSPLALVWMLMVRVSRGRLRPRPRGGADPSGKGHSGSDELDRPHRDLRVNPRIVSRADRAPRGARPGVRSP